MNGMTRVTMAAALAIVGCLISPRLARAQFSATGTADGLTTLYHMRCGGGTSGSAPGWTGADSTYSVKLPNGSIAWLFSDSFVGRVAPDATRETSGSSLFILGNTMNVQSASNGSLTTYLGGASGTETRPTYAFYPYDTANCPSASYAVPSGTGALFKPPSCPNGSACWLWMGDALLETSGGSTVLRAFLRSYEPGGVYGTWDNTWIGSIPTASLTTAPTYTAAPSWNLVMYGSAVTPDVSVGGTTYTYVYGVRNEPSSPRCTGNCMHVARVPKNAVTDLSQWRYYAGPNVDGTENWVTNGSLTQPLTGATGPGPFVSNEFSVTQVAQCGVAPNTFTCYVLVNQQTFFSPNIQVYYATSPAGPWNGPVTAYTTPESSSPIVTYNAHAHAWSLNADKTIGSNGLLVSYNINSNACSGLPPGACNKTVPKSIYANAANYRPKFIRVKLSW